MFRVMNLKQCWLFFLSPTGFMGAGLEQTEHCVGSHWNYGVESDSGKAMGWMDQRLGVVGR